jgi:hypothetical protein
MCSFPGYARNTASATDRERVAGLRALDRDRTGERIDAVPVELRDHARVAVGPDLVVADVTGRATLPAAR